MAEMVNQPLRAEDVLRVSSDREALDLSAQPFDQANPDLVVISVPTQKRSNLLTRVWNRHVVLTVSSAKCRDHFANERTALGYIRTAQAFAMMGVIISQVMRLMRSPHPDPVLGFFVVSIPLAAICHTMALVVCLLGLYRFLHWQNKMARDYAISSGWELTTIFALTVLILICIFVLILAIIVRDPDR